MEKIPDKNNENPSAICEKLKIFIEHKCTTNFILIVIIINSIVLGLMTYPFLNNKFGIFMHFICNICVFIYSIELFIKLYVYRKVFFKDGWNIFDFIIVAMAWIPTGGVFSSFRAFRILRTLRLVTRLEKLRIIVQAIIESIPNVGWTTLLLLLIFYIFAIMGTTLFSADFPEFFGSIGKSMFSLFQIMTLEGWSMELARPVIEVFPCSWVYFISFILISSFIVMNVIVGIVVNAISELNEKAKEEKLKIQIEKTKDINIELEKLKNQIKVVEALLNDKLE